MSLIKLLKEVYKPIDYENVVLYHGTADTSFSKFDINKAGTAMRSDWGKGIYFTRSKSTAQHYRAEAVKKTNKEYQSAFEEYERVAEEVNTQKLNSEERKRIEDFMYEKLNKFREISKKLDDTADGRIIVAKLKPETKVFDFNYHEGRSDMTDPHLADRIRNKGYDVLLIDANMFTEEWVVLNPEVIEITKSIK